MNANVTVLKDEALGGVEREYLLVNREARKGEKVVAIRNSVNVYDVGHVGIVTTSGSVDFSGQGNAYVRGDGVWACSYPTGYRVLEQTDIVRINGKRLRMVERKAVAGERITPIIKRPYVTVGKTYTVTEMSPSEEYPVYAHFIDDEGDRWHLPHSDYRVLEPVASAQPAPEPSMPSIAELTAITDGLTDAVAKLTLKVTELEKRVKVADSDVNITINVDVPKRKVLTRDDVIERAKADVAEITEDLFYRDKWRNTEYDTPGHMRVEFVVNRDKRTVVALVYSKYVSSGVWTRGIAKAAPGDVFNSHIGRAIALRRALGLEVPAEYTSAPQPSEPRVGDVVIFHSQVIGDRLSTLTNRVPKFDGNGYGNYAFHHTAVGGWIADSQYTLVDDSREEVAV
jgi:hypothetical protein